MANMSGESESESTALNSGGRDTFVVRIWSSDGSDSIRGHIQHVRSRKRAYFATRERLLTFIEAHLRPPEGDGCPG
jgi:hypothetical protein